MNNLGRTEHRTRCLRVTAALVLFGAAPLRAQTGGTVEGRVVNSATGAGIGGVTVTLWTQQGTNYHVTTDESGAWSVTDMKPGQYDSRFEKTGFIEPPRTRPWPASALRVEPVGAPIRLDTVLAPLATLRGRVLDPDGKPAPDIEVGVNEFPTVQTDGEGRFVLDDVKPGLYTLLAIAPAPAEKPAKAEREQVVPTYYPSAVTRSEAVKIPVRGCEELSGFEIRLRRSPVYRLRGVAFDLAGKPAPQATVHLTSHGNETVFRGQMMIANQRYLIGLPEQSEKASAQTDQEGAFEFAAVMPGEWYLRADTEPKRDSRQNLTVSSSEEVPVTVSDHDVAELRIQLPPTFTLQAEIDWGDHPPPGIGPQVYGALVLVSAKNSQLTLPRVLQETGGTVRLENVAARRYRIVALAGVPAGYYAASVTLAGQEILGTPVGLTAASPPLRITYKPNPGRVHGIVEKGEGATVLFWPLETAAPDLVRMVQTGAGGVFEIGGVPPGDYYVLALNGPNLQNLTESSLRSLIAETARVTLGENTSRA